MKNKRFEPKIKYYTRKDGAIVAVSSYAGQTIRGVAKCHPKDVWSQAKGERLARLRCKVKIAEKRYKNVEAQMQRAIEDRIKATAKAADYIQRCYEARMRLIDTRASLDKTLMMYDDD